MVSLALIALGVLLFVAFFVFVALLVIAVIAVVRRRRRIAETVLPSERPRAAQWQKDMAGELLDKCVYDKAVTETKAMLSEVLQPKNA